MKIIGQEYAKANWDKLVTWTCCLCGAGFAWAPKGKNAYYPNTGGVILNSEAFTLDRAPYVVTLADGKEHGFCSRGCVRTKALLVGLEAIVAASHDHPAYTKPGITVAVAPIEKDALKIAAKAVCPLCYLTKPARTEGVGIYCHDTSDGLEPCRAGKIWEMIEGK